MIKGRVSRDRVGGMSGISLIMVGLMIALAACSSDDVPETSAEATGVVSDQTIPEDNLPTGETATFSEETTPAPKMPTEPVPTSAEISADLPAPRIEWSRRPFLPLTWQWRI